MIPTHDSRPSYAMTTPIVDTHAHVFARDLALGPDRRYAPAYDATLPAYLALLDRHAIRFGVLVQPSFLGIDNSFLVASLASAGGRLRGIAVVEPDIADKALDGLAAAGIVGIRFNLIGRPPPAFLDAAELALARRVAARGWQIEVHAEGCHLAPVLDALAGLGTALVVDHYGRPDASLGLACPGFQALLATPPNVHVKLSAPYRFGTTDAGLYRDALLANLGPDRLLWGSDWPWTQHEQGQDFAALLAVANNRPEGPRLHANAMRLFGFPA